MRSGGIVATLSSYKNIHSFLRTTCLLHPKICSLRRFPPSTSRIRSVKYIGRNLRIFLYIVAPLIISFGFLVLREFMQARSMHCWRSGAGVGAQTTCCFLEGALSTTFLSPSLSPSPLFFFLLFCSAAFLSVLAAIVLCAAYPAYVTMVRMGSVVWVVLSS